MNTPDYTTTLLVPQTQEEVFSAINNVPAWWSAAFEGHSQKLKDVFTVSFGETYITLEVIELVPGRKIGWLVTDCHKNFLKDKKEWKGTRINWMLSAAGGATQIVFTHIGLVPGIECYNACEKAWDFYIKQSFFKLLTEGTGKPS